MAADTTLAAEKLRHAASRGQTNKVLDYLEQGAQLDVDKEGRTALHLAAAHGHVDTTSALLVAGCDPKSPDFAGFTPLQRAAAGGHTEIVRQLIRHGGDVDHQDELHGNTALHESAWKGYSLTVETLCKSRANPYITNKGGFTPLHLCCQNGHNQTCRVLLLSGCKPDIKNNYGDTPLHTSSRYGHAGVTRILISAQCQVSEQNKNGDTALHISAAMGRRKLTRILLESGCDKELTNKQLETAGDIATRKEFREIVSLLTKLPSQKEEKTEKEKKERKNEKKRDKNDSGTSSKESNSRRKDKKKHKSSRSHLTERFPNWSPYGCHYFPNIEEFPKPRLSSLPNDPLHKGEQYFLDLAGNIKKGPLGVGYTCYCAPFFHHVEQKLESGKKELINHIDTCHGRLDQKISHLEKRTRNQLHNLSQAMKEKLAAERNSCTERIQKQSSRDKQEVLRQQILEQRAMKTWLAEKLEALERRHGALETPRPTRRPESRQLSRCRSEEILSEVGYYDHPRKQEDPVYKGLRVLDYPSTVLKGSGGLAESSDEEEEGEDSDKVVYDRPKHRHVVPVCSGDFNARPEEQQQSVCYVNGDPPQPGPQTRVVPSQNRLESTLVNGDLAPREETLLPVFVSHPQTVGGVTPERPETRYLHPSNVSGLPEFGGYYCHNPLYQNIPSRKDGESMYKQDGHPVGPIYKPDGHPVGMYKPGHPVHEQNGQTVVPIHKQNGHIPGLTHKQMGHVAVPTHKQNGHIVVPLDRPGTPQDILDQAFLDDLPPDSHNDSGYSTKFYGSSQGPSPALSGAADSMEGDGDRRHVAPRIQALQNQLTQMSKHLENMNRRDESSLV